MSSSICLDIQTSQSLIHITLLSLSVAHSFFGVGAVGSALSGESAEGAVLCPLVLESKSLDDLGGSVDLLGEKNFGSGDSGLRLGGLGLLGTVAELVLQGEGENSAEVLLGLLMASSDTNGAG